MTFNIQPDDDMQAFAVTVTDNAGHKTVRHAHTKDILAWLRDLVVVSECSFTIATDINPMDHPQPRYMIESEVR